MGHLVPVVDGVCITGWVIAPRDAITGRAEVAIDGGRIAAVGVDLSRTPRKKTVDVHGAVVCPGLVDLHVHCYAWLTPFGLRADDVGVNAGCTTIVDQGSAGAWTFGGFLQYLAKPSTTDVPRSPSINLAPPL